ncbi:hypothetical protein GL263_19050 [Streptomyces durbertensis]|uniref:Uncharacterized protein n=1 Tax=Streptomyces durbertensis TaxID=2448886 RepID=A0ABR6EJY6_9ACTN|nr:hypothetical protein [Streptomyces durbertensis]MBB1245641.1 hypothetical protein [Streptomyces durbertensis]
MGTHGAGVSVLNRAANAPYSAHHLTLCLDRPGSVNITDVSFEHVEGGLQVEAFATRKAVWNTDGSADGPLSEINYDPSETRVATVCDDRAGKDEDGLPTQLALQLNKPTDATARGVNLVLRYESAGRTHTHRVDFELVLCRGDDKHPECALKGADAYRS